MDFPIFSHGKIHHPAIGEPPWRAGNHEANASRRCQRCGASSGRSFRRTRKFRRPWAMAGSNRALGIWAINNMEIMLDSKLYNYVFIDIHIYIICTYIIYIYIHIYIYTIYIIIHHYDGGIVGYNPTWYDLGLIPNNLEEHVFFSAI